MLIGIALPTSFILGGVAVDWRAAEHGAEWRMGTDSKSIVGALAKLSATERRALTAAIYDVLQPTTVLLAWSFGANRACGRQAKQSSE